MRIDAMHWVQVEEALARDDRCILPLGCTEQHAFLSLATDTLLAQKLANDVAERADIVAFPALAYGLTPSFAAYPGTASLSYETYGRVVKDLLTALFRQGFRRILIINGHGGNTPARACAMEWLAEYPEAKVRWHDWWNAPKTLAAVHAIDPVASHASWMENFPWTRLDGVESPDVQKPMIDFALLRTLDPVEVRRLLGDGNFGGRYQRSDEAMAAIWSVAIDETLSLIEGDW